MAQTITGCPECGAALVGGNGFVQWCPACDWNVDPLGTANQHGNWLTRRQLERQNRRSLALYADIERHGVGFAGRGVRVVTWLLAGVVHAITIGLLVGAVVVAISGLPLVERVIVTTLLLAFFAYIQPWIRRRRLPPGTMLKRATAPVLFGLMDNIADDLKTRRVDTIVVSTQFNMMYLRGKRRKPLITIGMPMWACGNPQQHVAWLGHEFAHQKNGDLRDGVFVWTALVSMARWQFLFTPPAGAAKRRFTRSGAPAAANLVLPIVLLPVFVLISAFGTALLRASQRQGQRSEYLADLLMAQTAGTTGAAEAIDLTMLDESCWNKLVRTIRFARDQDPWRALDEHVRDFPPDERERLRRVAGRRLNRIDSTHPPSYLRWKLLTEMPPQSARVVVDTGSANAISSELHEAAAAATERLRRQLT